MGTKITEIVWISAIFVKISIKSHFFEKKTAEKFVSSKKSITFAPAIERDSRRKAEFSCKRAQKVYFMPSAAENANSSKKMRK